MPGTGQNIIEFGFDVDKLTKQQTEILNILTTIYEASKKMDGLKMGLFNAAGYADITKAMQGQNAAIVDITGSITKLQKKTEEQKITEQILAAERRKNLKEQAREALGLNDAYDKLNKKQKELSKSEKDASAQKILNSKAYKEGKMSANDLSDALGNLEKKTGDAHRDVGKYAEGIKKAFEDVLPEAEGASGKIQGFLSKFGPWGVAAASAIALVGAPLTAFWAGTAEGAKRAEIRMAEFEGAMEVVSSKFAKVGKFIDNTIFGDPEKSKGAVTFWESAAKFLPYWIGSIPVIKNLAKQMDDVATAEGKVAEMMHKNREEQIALITERSALNLKLVEARESAIDENKTIAQKIDLYTEVFKESKKLQEIDVQAAKNDQKALEDKKKILEPLGKWYLDNEEELQKAIAHTSDVSADYDRARIKGEKQVAKLETELRKEETDLHMAVVKDKIEHTDAANKKILENEKSTLIQRIAAERSIMQGKLTVLGASTEEKLKAPGLDDLKKAQIVQESQTERFKIISEEAAQELKLREDYAKREAIAVTEIEKTKIQAQKDELNDELKFDSQLYTSKMNLQERLIILQKLTNLDLDAENKSYDKQILESAKKTPKEIEAITEAHNLKLKGINSKAQFDATEATKKFYKEQIDVISLSTEQAENVTMAGFNEKYASLLGKSPRAQSRGKETIEKQESLANIDTQIGAVTQKKGLAHDQGDIKAEADFQKQLLDLTRKRIDAQMDLEKKKAEDIKALEHAAIELAKKTGEFIGQQAKDRIEKKQNQLGVELGLIETQKEAEIERINSSTMAESDKAIEIKRINAEALNEKKKIDLEERKLKQQQAKIDKEMALFNAIVSVAQGVAASLAYGGPVGIALAVITAAMGAIEIASIASKPIPAMEKGGTVKKTGIILTDEKGPEGYIEPGGSLKIGSDSGANYKYLKAGTRVIPNDVLMSSMMQASSTDFSDSGSKNDGKMDKLIQLTAANQAILKKQNKKNNITIHNNIGAGLDHEAWLNRNVRY
jgi:hypothetical protein